MGNRISHPLSTIFELQLFSRRSFAIARRGHVAQADGEDSERHVNDLDYPVKLAGHKRGVKQSENDRNRADDDRAGRD